VCGRREATPLVIKSQAAEHQEMQRAYYGRMSCSASGAMVSLVEPSRNGGSNPLIAAQLRSAKVPNTVETVKKRANLLRSSFDLLRRKPPLVQAI
jgi:hypothetical protein